MAKKKVVEELDMHAVMYTDGSCVLPAGATGGGIHGYIHNCVEEVRNGDQPSGHTVTNKGYLKPHEMSNALDDMLAATGNSAAAPKPYRVKPVYYLNAAISYGLGRTNNVGELKAAIDVINLVMDKVPVVSMLILTDSTYVLNVFKAVRKHVPDRPWNDKPDRPNIDLWNEVADTIIAYPKLKLKLAKVKAHTGVVGNTEADINAYVGREMAFKGMVGPVYKFYTGKYWKDKPTPHPMLNFKQLYFNTGIEPATDGKLYVAMDYPKDVEVGKKTPEPIFGVVILKDGASEVDNLTDMYKEISVGTRYISAIDLRVVYSQVNHKLVEVFGKHAYTTSKRVIRLVGETPVVTPISPPGLAQKMLATTLKMYSNIVLYESGELDSDTSITDITDQLYQPNAKGKLQFIYPQSIVGPKVNISTVDAKVELILVYGLDMLARNHMKKLETMSPKVCVITKKLTDNSYSYHLIIETTAGIGCYGNFYVNKLYT